LKFTYELIYRPKELEEKELHANPSQSSSPWIVVYSGLTTGKRRRRRIYGERRRSWIAFSYYVQS
jgi:hypothetical protein